MKRAFCALTSLAMLILMAQVGLAGVSPGGLGTHPEDMDAQYQSDGVQADALAYQQIEEFVEQIASEILPSGGAQAVAMTAGCVEVDIELPALVEFEPGGGIPFATGYFELVNCGDEAAQIILDLEASIYIEGVIDTTFAIGGIPVMMAAGEVISRELTFPVPPFDASYTICVAATSGDAVANDCATMVVEGVGGAGPTSMAPGERLSDRPSDMYANTHDGAVADDMAAMLSDFVYELFSQIVGEPLGASMATECVEVDIELPDTILVEDGLPSGSGYFELINCGDEAAEIMLQLEATIVIEPYIDTTFVFPAVPVTMGAGEVISHEFMFLAPPFDGSYTFCVTAASGEAQDADCATMVVVGGEWPGPPAWAPAIGMTAHNYPNPFNPATTILLSLPTDANVKLEIYNVLGRVVRTLADDYLSAGEHEFLWDGTDGNGNRAASGVYFYRVQSGSYSLVKKMLLVK